MQSATLAPRLTLQSEDLGQTVALSTGYQEYSDLNAFTSALTDNRALTAAASYNEPFGKVVDAVVIKDRDTGRSRGFGFVTCADDAAGRTALEAMNGATLDGLVDADVATVDDRPVHRLQGGGPRRVVGEAHEAEAAAPSGLAVP